MKTISMKLPYSKSYRLTGSGQKNESMINPVILYFNLLTDSKSNAPNIDDD